MPADFNPALLLLARQFRQKSQAVVARDAGLAQGHYSKIENGLLPDGPSAHSIERIADALKFPVGFFYQSDGLAGLPLSVHPMHRKLQSVGARVLQQVHAELNIRLMHLRRYIRVVDFTPELPLPTVDVDDAGGPAKIARSIRTAWSIPSGPVANLIDRCERAGVIIVLCDFDAPIDGVTMTVHDLPPCVFLKRNVTADRMRSSLAHELGHIVMHRVPSDDMEDEAQAFASELLVPADEFRRAAIGQRITAGWLARQKMYWRVSMGFLLYKAGSLGLITRHQSEYLWRRFSALGWKTREPQETDIEREEPSVFPRMVSLHTTDLGYGVSEIGKLLNVSESDLWALYGRHLAPGGRGGLRLVQ